MTCHDISRLLPWDLITTNHYLHKTYDDIANVTAGCCLYIYLVFLKDCHFDLPFLGGQTIVCYLDIKWQSCILLWFTVISMVSKNIIPWCTDSWVVWKHVVFKWSGCYDELLCCYNVWLRNFRDTIFPLRVLCVERSVMWRLLLVCITGWTNSGMVV